MYRHVVLWKLKETYSEEEKQEIRTGIKTGLESLAGKIPGMTSIHVSMQRIDTSNADVMLDCSFTDEASLRGYGKHPEHLAVANTKVRPFTQERLCLDFLED